jgi:hypothetical protein
VGRRARQCAPRFLDRRKVRKTVLFILYLRTNNIRIVLRGVVLNFNQGTVLHRPNLTVSSWPRSVELRWNWTSGLPLTDHGVDSLRSRRRKTFQTGQKYINRGNNPCAVPEGDDRSLFHVMRHSPRGRWSYRSRSIHWRPEWRISNPPRPSRRLYF